MRKQSSSILLAMSLGLVMAAASHGQSGGVDPSAGSLLVSNGVTRFATLPAGAPAHPEGLWADSVSGNIYSASFELTNVLNSAAQILDTMLVGPAYKPLFPAVPKDANGAPLPPYQNNYIYTFGPDGTLLTSTPMSPDVVPLGVTSVGNKLYVNDVINGDELQFTLPLTATSVPAQTFHICAGFAKLLFNAPGTFCALNANYVGPDGRVYISDNGAGGFGETKGNVYVLNPNDGTSSIFLNNSQLDVGYRKFPPYGVNGVAFSRDGAALYMANMSTDTIYKVTLTNCNTACRPVAFSVFIQGNGIDGPDNMDFDDKGNLWIASGQNNSVVAVNPQGQVVAAVGSFDGFYGDGASKGLLQPSGVGFANGTLYIGNESSQSLVSPSEPVDWTQLKLFTLSSIVPAQQITPQ